MTQPPYQHLRLAFHRPHAWTSPAQRNTSRSTARSELEPSPWQANLHLSPSLSQQKHRKRQQKGQSSTIPRKGARRLPCEVQLRLHCPGHDNKLPFLGTKGSWSHSGLHLNLRIPGTSSYRISSFPTVYENLCRWLLLLKNNQPYQIMLFIWNHFPADALEKRNRTTFILLFLDRTFGGTAPWTRAPRPVFLSSGKLP